jgi:hypothetical protein
MVLRRMAFVGLAAIVTGGIIVAALPGKVAHAQSGGGCQLTGTASITPGLTTSSQSFTYSFSGTLTNCQSNTSGAPTSGTVFAGVDPTGQKETAGYPSGTGSCGNSTTSGVAVAQFSDGSTAVISFTTSGAAAAVSLQGTVVASAAFGTNTYTTSAEWAGDSAVAALTFQPASGQNCVTVPVTTAAIAGATGIGKA